MLLWRAVIPLILLWLRAAGLVGQGVALGSAVFSLVVLPREPARSPAVAFDRAVTALARRGVGIGMGGRVGATMPVPRAEASQGNAWRRPFWVVAAAAVGGIAVTGVALSLACVATPGAAIGTSYGAMVLAKIVLFAALLVMAVLNHRALHGRLALGPWSGRGSTGDGGSVLLRRRLEVEAGLAVVTVLLAASIGSAPPAVDVGGQRATPEESRAVVTPPS